MLVLAVLAVLSFGAAAATLDSTTGTGVGGSDDGVGVEDGDSGFSLGGVPENETTQESGVEVPPVLFRAVTALLVAVALLGFAYMLYEGGLATLRRLAVVAVVGALFMGLVYAIVQFIGDATDDGQGGLFGRGPSELPSGGTAGAGDAAATAVNTPSTVVAVVLGVAVLAAVAVLVRATGDTSTAPTEPPAEPDGTDAAAAAVGRAAGRAADRIEADTGVDNAVFRAWREMTDDLELPRETSTPGEFADAAVAAGMEPGDVRELTTLFEDVRYGGETADEQREQRALAALRRIEDAYGERR